MPGEPSLPDSVSIRTTGSTVRPDDAASALLEKPALSLFPMSLTEALVEEANIELAWKNVKTNRGAPGPDGITITEFPTWFRPRWNAIRQQLLDGTYRYAVDMDLSKFFDRVGHDVLMARVARKVRDKTVLQLIGRYLRAGVMVDGHFQATTEGTPQGGPASPLLANILLGDLDKELENRGLRFVRYADDFVIFTRTKRSAERVFASVHRYPTRQESQRTLAYGQDDRKWCRDDE
jgi:retron-type reverse transcriptase